MRNNRVNLRLTDAELKKLDKMKGNKSRSGFLRDLAFSKQKSFYILIDENETPVAVFRLKRNAEEAAKAPSFYSVVKARYD